jgi:hypothetical protein
MKRLWILGLSATAVLLAGSFARAATITVDEFSAVQFLTVTGPPGPPVLASSTVASPGILGGAREGFLQALGGLDAQTAQAVAFDLGGGINSLFYSQDSTIFSTYTATYDGGGPGFNPTGLGGFDLTDGGTEFGLELGINFMDSPYKIELTAYDASDPTGGKWSKEAFTVAGPIFAPTFVTIPYGHFGDGSSPNDVGPNGPVSFGNVGALTMKITSVNKGADIEVNYLKTSVVPEPASIATALIGAALCGFGYLRRRNRGK